MADIKITQLGDVSNISDSDVMIIDDGTSTLKTTAEKLRKYAVKQTEEAIAPREISPSVRAYAIGQEFIYNSVLYTATEDIEIGDDIEPEVNCTRSENLTEQIKKTFSGATSSAAGSVGSVPQPAAGQQNATLFGDGTWKTLLYDVLSRYENLGNGYCAQYEGDLNAIKHNSVYNVNPSSNSANLPESQWGFLVTYIHSLGPTYATQVWLSMQTGTNMFIRMKVSGNWQAWKKVTETEIGAFTATFASSDPGPTNDGLINNGFTSVSAMASGDTVQHQFDKISRMFYNIRKSANTITSLWNNLMHYQTETGEVPSKTGINLNDINVTSIYNVDSSCSNLPPGVNFWGFVVTFYKGTYGSQIWTSMAYGNNNAYVRVKDGGSWSSWKRLTFGLTKRSVTLTLSNGYRQYDTGRSDIVCATGTVLIDGSVQCVVTIQDSRYLRVWANAGNNNVSVVYWTYD